ncbi:outer membrane lipoprotein-sorting protein [Phytopseudomonas dryadis]|uniref:outer membrane lipoprotein-sorting protein n=1 Tax=Phytopseudomonas dryadis TaxID=2487520 RepID=UPI001F602CFB|nr:outer membrane lipoprotein-sorting protein [Pseudomonas dryadis]
MHKYAAFILRHRLAVIVVTLLLTAVLGTFGAGLKIVIDPATLAPQDHPLIKSTNQVEAVFGSKYLMIIGITPEQGDIFQPKVLLTVRELTARLDATPGVVRSTLLSLGSRQARGIKGTEDGFEARSLLGDDPLPDMETLRHALATNPVYQHTVVSGDQRSAAILVELKERSDGFTAMLEPIHQVIDEFRGQGLNIALGGNPVYLEKTEEYAQRINILFPIAILVIGLLHLEAFRTLQGLVLPLVTALMAVAWGTGFMGMLGQPMDIFNSPTPILILAVAAGHAVQLLKRYYEDYARLRQDANLSPAEANQQAVIASLVGVGPVMLIAGSIAAVGFFSLLVFDIATIRSFGIFTGIGILCAMLLEMTFIPAVRSLLKPPGEKALAKEERARIWDRIAASAANLVVAPGKRAGLFAGFALITLALVYGMQGVVIDNASKKFFASSLDIQRDDDLLNNQFGGTNSLYVMVEGPAADAIKRPDVLAAMADLQRYAEAQAHVGKTLSMVDYLQRMNKAMHGDQASFDTLPDSQNLISQYLLLYSMSGEPGDFDSWVDYNYQRAKITLLLKTGDNAVVKALLAQLQARAQETFPPDIRLSFGGDVAQTVALTETLVNGKLHNILQVAMAIFLISSLVFRSPLAGLIVLTPLALAVVAVFGIMGWLQIPLNIPNSLISAMAVGIGADYAIYILYRLREQVRAGQGAEEAVRSTLATAGKACLFVATAVAGGYGVLALSIGYNVHLWLSMFIVIAMLVSVLASLTLVPALALALRPRFIFGGSAPLVPQFNNLVLLAVAVSCLGLGARSLQAAEVDAAQIMQRSFEVTKVQDSSSKATFTLINAAGEERVRQTEGVTRLKADSLDNRRYVKFLSPQDIKGTATLLVEHSSADDDMWIYLPALNKVRRLSASNKRDSFVGTDFSYGDIVGHNPGKWQHRLLGDKAAADGTPAYEVESIPIDQGVAKDTGYSRMVSLIGKDHLLPLRIEFFNLAGQPLKRIDNSLWQAVGSQGKWQAMQSEASNLQTGHRTVIALHDYQADQGVTERYFRPQSLDR